MMICSPAKVVVGCVLNSPAMVFVRLVFKQPGHGLCSLSVLFLWYCVHVVFDHDEWCCAMFMICVCMLMLVCCYSMMMCPLLHYPLLKYSFCLLIRVLTVDNGNFECWCRGGIVVELCYDLGMCVYFNHISCRLSSSFFCVKSMMSFNPSLLTLTLLNFL